MRDLRPGTRVARLTSEREPQRRPDSARPGLLALLRGRDLAEAGIRGPTVGKSRVWEAEIGDVEEVGELRFLA